MSIVYLAQMSAPCRVGLPELCTDASCEAYWHDQDDLESLDLSDEDEAASWLAADDAGRRRADV